MIRIIAVIAGVILTGIWILWVTGSALGMEPVLDPNPKLTPGKVEVTDVRVVCAAGYSRRARHVSDAVRRQVWKRYGYDTVPTGDWELDHLIPIELGGSNDADNLWPQPSEPVPGYHEKDWVEQVLHRLVCSNLMSLQTAQARVRDWVAVWIILHEHLTGGKPLGIGGVS